MVNILMVTHNQLPDVRVEKEARDLINEGHLVYLITPKISDTNATESFTKVFTYNHNIKHNFFLRKAVNHAIEFCSEITEKYRINIIHAHNIYSANYAAKVAKKYNLIFIYDDHETWSIYLKEIAKAGLKLTTKILRFYIYLKSIGIERRLTRQAKHIFVTNVKCIDFFVKKRIPQEKITAIENVVLQSEIDEALNSDHLVLDFFKTDKRMKIINIHHQATGVKANQINRDALINRKFDRFIDAAEQLDNWVLVLLGKKDPILEERGVVFFDKMPRIAYLANTVQADIGVNPLTINPKTLISSQNRIYDLAKLGVRTISTRTPLLEENFQNNLIWFNPNDPVKKLVEILQNIENYPSGKELQEYSKKFSWKNEKQKMIDVYKKF
ncbi:MAG: glycosyltransferase [Candidatus Heimdallarchaeota archaeon]